MNVNDIEDVLNLRTVLETRGNSDVAHQPYLIAALLDWKNGTTGEAGFIANQDEAPEPVAAQPVAPPAKAAAKKAPAKKVSPPAKSRPSQEPDDSVTGDEDADF